jgi:hypothetical protein
LLPRNAGAFTLGDSAENEYLMKCVMRVIAFMGPEIKPFATQCQAQIVGMLVVRPKRSVLGSASGSREEAHP